MKQYDFTCEVQPVGEPFRKVCIEVVRNINWHDVFGSPDAESLDGWGGDSPDWQTWGETYGQCPKRFCCARIIRIYGYHSSCALAESDAGIVNFYQTKDTLMGHVDRSEICATSPLVSIS
jgi:alkylated DNA repair protein alkB family protein 1